jgi:hypothetical protein
MKKVLLLLLSVSLLPLAARAQIQRVAGQNVGISICSPGVAKALPSNVTAGNWVVVSAFNYQGTAPNAITATGTAKLGTWTKDADLAGTAIEVSIWHASVTTGGSLTVTESRTGAVCSGLAVEEYAGISGVDAADTNTGTSTTESTNAITTTAANDVIVMASSEGSTGNFTYTFSDNALWSDAKGATDFTFAAQDKITASSGTYTLTAGIGVSWPWDSVAVAFKAVPVAPPPPPPPPPPVTITLTGTASYSNSGTVPYSASGTVPYPAVSGTVPYSVNVSLTGCTPTVNPSDIALSCPPITGSLPWSSPGGTVPWTASGTVPWTDSGTAPYSQTLTLTGLAAGCQATLSGSTIAISGCAPNLATVTIAPVCSTGTTAGHTVTLNWTDGDTGLTGFNIYRGAIAGGPYSKIVSATGLTYTDSGVTSGQTYYYVVTAINAAGESAYSNEAKATIPTP